MCWFFNALAVSFWHWQIRESVIEKIKNKINKQAVTVGNAQICQCQ
jgi:hypothetical protein